MRDLNKFRGCMIGGAVGDALGYTVEFMPDTAILQKYGARGIRKYELRNGLAEISDDTQMTLFTATGLLLGTTRGMTRGIMGPYPSYIAYSYQDWFQTQTKAFPLGDEYHYSWLVNVPELFCRRAPGNTCLSAIEHGANGTIENPINQSKGCGGIMRVAPIGLYFIDKQYTQAENDRIGAETAALTHGHELGYIPAAALVHMLSLLAGQQTQTIRGAAVDAMAAMPKLFPETTHMHEFITLLQRAIDLSASHLDDLDAIRQLGEGWVAEETLAIAVYCALKYSNDFERAIIASVNHSGDSDSTGAVTGNILGAHLGLDAIPAKYTEKLELKAIVQELADDLYHDCKISEYGDYRDEVWERKYIYMNYLRES